MRFTESLEGVEGVKGEEDSSLMLKSDGKVCGRSVEVAAVQHAATYRDAILNKRVTGILLVAELTESKVVWTVHILIANKRIQIIGVHGLLHSSPWTILSGSKVHSTAGTTNLLSWFCPFVESLKSMQTEVLQLVCWSRRRSVHHCCHWVIAVCGT